MAQQQPVVKQIDFYTLVHKALRRELFNLAIDMGKVDFTDKEKIKKIVHQIGYVMSILRHHAEHEDKYFHPFLQKKIPEAFSQLHTEHEAQEVFLKKIETLANGLLREKNEKNRVRDGQHLYRVFNLFIKDYLEHLEEEEATMPILWECSTYKELKEVVDTFLANADLQVLGESLTYIFPAIPKADREEILTDMRKNAPPEAYQRARKLADAALN